MIKRIDHNRLEQANQIYQIFQRAYPVEAAFLKVALSVFPPMRRSAEDIATSQTSFYGYFVQDQLAGAMELTTLEPFKINSFVVHPSYFKQGIGSKMMAYVLAQFPRNKYIVETGRENVPAISLYQKFGFEIVKEYPLPEGIRKVVMEKDGLK